MYLHVHVLSIGIYNNPSCFVFLHVSLFLFLPFSLSSTLTQSSSPLLAALNNASTNNNITLTPSSRHKQLPPASLQRFLRVNRDLPGVVVTSYDRHFNNRCAVVIHMHL